MEDKTGEQFSEDCYGGHHFFVAETVGVPLEGKVFVLLACTSCGVSLRHEHVVSKPGAYQMLASEEIKIK